MQGNQKGNQGRQQGRRRRFQAQGNPNGVYRSTVMVQRELSTYLEMRDGKVPPAKVVMDFMMSVKNLCQERYAKSEIYKIITPNGLLASYPVFTTPEEIPEESTWVKREIYKKNLENYHAKIQALAEHKLALMGVIERHMSEDVKQRVRACDEGHKGYEEQDPLMFLRAVFQQLMSDDQTDSLMNVMKITEQWSNLRMQDYESEGRYYQRAKSILQALSEAYRRVDSDPKTQVLMPHPQMQAVQYISRLNSRFDKLKRYYIDKVREWPKTIDEAHLKAAEFIPDPQPVRKQPVVAGEPDREPAYGFAATKSEKDERKPSYKSTVQCYKCEKYGHYARECPDKQNKTNGDIGKAVNQVRSEKSPK
jgi:Zinc knuckle